jgi:NAD-dependent SIR2 family protein deacetylase
MDALIVIGTALATNMAKRIVNNALKKQNIPVIEINLESAIDKGFNI